MRDVMREASQTIPFFLLNADNQQGVRPLPIDRETTNPRGRTPSAGTTTVELVVAIAMLTLVTAAIMPVLGHVPRSWDTWQNDSETVQNGRVPIDPVHRNLAEATKITAASSASESSGYIQFVNNTPGDLVAHWKLDGTSGTTASDSSGMGNHGTLKNMAGNEWTAGPVGGALALDGTNDYIEVSSLSAPTDKTFSCWIYIDSLTADFHTLIEFANDAPWFGIALWEGKWYLYEFDKTCWGATSLSTGQWYHVAYTSDSATDKSKIYLNGIDITESPANANTETGSGMGIGYHSGDMHFGGKIDDVRIYQRALSAEEIVVLYEAEAASGVVYQGFTEAKAGIDTTSVTIAIPSGTITGDLLISAVATDGDADLSLAAPAGEGWTEMDTNSSSSQERNMLH